jgi:transcription initiation factor TFIIB
MYYQFPKKCITANCIKSIPITDELTGEILCGRCGLVFAEKTVSLDETQFYTLEDHLNKSRTGLATSLIMYDRGLYTTMNVIAMDARGKPISKNMKSEFFRLRLWDERQKSSSANKSLRSALVNISTLRDKLSIPDPIAERASYICRKALENQVARGRTISSISCAALYAACRESNTPRTLDEITEAANVPKRKVSHTYNTLLHVLNLQPTCHDLAEFVNKLGNQLGVSERTKRKALDILSKIQDKEICAGRNPKSIVAALLYLACTLDGEKRKQSTIAKTASVCPTTIQSTMRILKKNLNVESL